MFDMSLDLDVQAQAVILYYHTGDLLDQGYFLFAAGQVYVCVCGGSLRKDWKDLCYHG